MGDAPDSLDGEFAHVLRCATDVVRPNGGMAFMCLTKTGSPTVHTQLGSLAITNC